MSFNIYYLSRRSSIDGGSARKKKSYGLTTSVGNSILRMGITYRQNIRQGKSTKICVPRLSLLMPVTLMVPMVNVPCAYGTK